MLNQYLTRGSLVALLLLAVAPVHALDSGSGATATAELSTPATVQASSALGAPEIKLAGISNKDQIGSLKQALAQCAETAVSSLSKKDGYLSNDKVRIPLPDSLQNAADQMSRFGLGKYADELITSINRAAEAAVPEARPHLIAAVKKMTVADGRSILTGSNNAATQYFRNQAEASLRVKFKPIINKAMERVNVFAAYGKVVNSADQYGFREIQNLQLDDYITTKAIDGLFLIMAEQEAALRANPMRATGNLAKKVFSAIRP